LAKTAKPIDAAISFCSSVKTETMLFNSRSRFELSYSVCLVSAGERAAPASETFCVRPFLPIHDALPLLRLQPPVEDKRGRRLCVNVRQGAAGGKGLHDWKRRNKDVLCLPLFLAGSAAAGLWASFVAVELENVV
jgi:hypothetical protein